MQSIVPLSSASRSPLPYQAPPTAGDAPGRVDLATVFSGLLAHKKIIVLGFCAFFTCMMLVTLLTPKTYTSTVKFIAGGATATGEPPTNAVDSGLPILNALLAANGGQTAETYAELLHELPVGQRVIDRLNLPLTATELYKHVLIRPVTHTSILTLSVTWKDAATAALIANAFADAFVDRERELVSSQATSAIERLSAQIPAAEATYHAAQARLNRYQNRHSIVDIAAQTQAAVNTQAAIEGRIRQVRADHQQAIAQLDDLRAELAKTPPTVLGETQVTVNPALEALQTQLRDVEFKLSDAQQRYTSRYPLLVELRGQRDALENQLAGQSKTITAENRTIANPSYEHLRDETVTASALVASTSAELASLSATGRADASSLQIIPQQTTRVADLTLAVGSAQQVMSELKRKLGEATVAQASALGDVVITERAFADTALKSPDVLRNVLFGIFGGIVSGLVAALLVGFFDRTLRDESEAERALGLPILTSVPLLELASKRPVASSLRVAAEESIWRLLVALRFASDVPLRTILVTSAQAGEGKTTVALRTAAALAEIEPGILLIDADMRRSTLHKRLAISNDVGLSDVLVRRVSLSGAIQHSPYPGLDCLTSGTPAPNPARLLQSALFDEILQQAMSRYRMVIFDSAALEPVSDSALIASKVDATVLVVALHESDVTKSQRVVLACERLGITNLLGMVVNKAAPQRRPDIYFEPMELEAAP